jgi:DNA polymerase-3 subunit epsilon
MVNRNWHDLTRVWRTYKEGGIPAAVMSLLDSDSAATMAYIRSMMKESRQMDELVLPLDQLNVVAIDLETTGFYPSMGDEIIAFGAVKLSKKGQEDKLFYTLVNPRRAIPPDVVRLTGIDDEMVASADELLAVLKRFISFLGKSVLVAHAAAHDTRFLNAALWKTCRGSLTNRVVDLLMIAKGLYPKLQDYALETLVARGGLKLKRRHHALEDAKMAADLWRFYVELLRDKGIMTLRDLYHMLH